MNGQRLSTGPSPTLITHSRKNEEKFVKLSFNQLTKGFQDKIDENPAIGNILANVKVKTTNHSDGKNIDFSETSGHGW